MRIYFIILGLSLALQLSAQRGANSNYGTKSLSIGGISSVLKGNDAIINNFAAITGASELGIILSSERRFSLQELTSITMGIHLPTGKFGHLGLRINSYGFNDYKEQKISLAYAKKLHKKIAVSANLDYNSLRISEHGSTQFLSFGIGFFGEISKSLRYGISIFTPEKITIVNETEVPSFLKFGIAKSFSDKLEASVEIEKIIDETINVKMGVDLALVPQFHLRAGFNSNPGQFGFGMSYILSELIQIDGGFNYDTLLGVTPSISISYSKKPKAGGQI